MMRVSRRSFIQAAGIGALGVGGVVAGGAALAQGEPEARNKRDGMRYRVLGRTNLLVSELAIGGLGPKAEVIGAALDRGVNLIHTCQSYPNSFAEIAKVFPARREEVFLAIKAVGGVAEFPNELAALKTDRADILFHPTDKVEDAQDANGAIRERFAAFKEKGLVRFMGLTCHSNVGAVAAAAVEAGHWDVIMPRYAMDVRAEVAPAIDTAHEKKVGVLAMKSLANTSGDATKTAFQTALEKPGVTAVLKGLPSFELLDTLVKAMAERPTAEAQVRLWEQIVAGRGSACGMCSKCSACPQNVAIEEALVCLLYYDAQLGEPGYARQVYRALPAERTVAACRDCGTCEHVCPNRLPVRELLREADTRLA
jgi:uncharacterized protein